MFAEIDDFYLAVGLCWQNPDQMIFELFFKFVDLSKVFLFHKKLLEQAKTFPILSRQFLKLFENHRISR